LAKVEEVFHNRLQTLALQAHTVVVELCLQMETAIRMVTVEVVAEVLYSVHLPILLLLEQVVVQDFLRDLDILIIRAALALIMEPVEMEVCLHQVIMERVVQQPRVERLEVQIVLQQVL
jgi:hypothetical protein